MAVLEMRKISKAAKKEKMESLWMNLGLGPMFAKNQRNGTFRVGERRRTEIARALAHGSRLYIMDEPFAV